MFSPLYTSPVATSNKSTLQTYFNDTLSQILHLFIPISIPILFYHVAFLRIWNAGACLSAFHKLVKVLSDYTFLFQLCFIILDFQNCAKVGENVRFTLGAWEVIMTFPAIPDSCHKSCQWHESCRGIVQSQCHKQVLQSQPHCIHNL
jgi:hypothetical protein